MAPCGGALVGKSDQHATVPLFIIGFVVAAAIRSLPPQYLVTRDGIAFVARRLLVVTLFLIGAGVSRETRKSVGFRPMVQGVTLWVIVSSVTLAAILSRRIGE